MDSIALVIFPYNINLSGVDNGEEKMRQNETIGNWQQHAYKQLRLINSYI